MNSKLIITISILTSLFSCATEPEKLDKPNLTQFFDFNEVSRIEWFIFPNPKHKRTIRGPELNDKREIEILESMVNQIDTLYEVDKFNSLPDGFVAIYKSQTHLENIYFSIDSSNTYLQLLDDIPRNIKLNKRADVYFRREYIFGKEVKTPSNKKTNEK